MKEFPKTVICSLCDQDKEAGNIAKNGEVVLSEDLIFAKSATEEIYVCEECYNVMDFVIQERNTNVKINSLYNDICNIIKNPQGTLSSPEEVSGMGYGVMFTLQYLFKHGMIKNDSKRI